MEELGIFSDSNNDSRGGQSNREGNNGATIVSVIENRAREVSIAKYHTRQDAVVEVYFLSDNHLYSETLGVLDSLCPDEVLLHDGYKHSTLTKKIQENIANVSSRVLFISRQYYDQDKGADMLKKVTVGKQLDADLVAKYIVLAGCYCLLKYVENCEGTFFAQNSLRIEYATSSHGRMTIDRRTASDLELVTGNSFGGNQKANLFCAINYTKTMVGARFLRASILRPSMDLPTISSRQEVVEILLGHNQEFVNIAKLLPQFPDLDRMLAGMIVVPKTQSLKTARTSIDTLIFLKQALRLAPQIVDAITMIVDKIQSAISQEQAQLEEQAHVQQTHGNGRGLKLLKVIMETLNDSDFVAFQRLIDETITESTTYSRSSHEMRHQECFAVKTGVHGLLDVARKTFLQSVEDIYQVAESYTASFGFPVKVVFNTSRGYYLSVSSDVEMLPPVFKQAVRNKRTISCSTAQVSSLSQRAQDAIENALSLTHQLLQDLMQRVRERMDGLYAMVDGIALLDMLASFADLVALCPHQLTRPNVTADGALFIEAGSHPILSLLNPQHSASSFVSNNAYLDGVTPFMLITGPNGAGKTVFIKQIALITILSQIGCFVPAKFATIPVRDCILSRLGTFDDIENNMSTFFTEMKEAAHILNKATPQSLVIVDELGRATSNIDGLSLAISIAESIIASQAFALFVTHFPQISALAKMYPSVKNIHLKTSVIIPAVVPDPGIGGAVHNNDAGAAVNTSIKFLYEVGNGPCEMKSGYGIMLSEICGFPADMVAEARRLQGIVRNLFPVLINEAVNVDMNIGVIRDLLQQLLMLKHSTLDHAGIRRFLSNIRIRMPPAMVDGMKQYISLYGSHQLSGTPVTSEASAVLDLDQASGSRALDVCGVQGATVIDESLTARVISTPGDKAIQEMLVDARGHGNRNGDDVICDDGGGGDDDDDDDDDDGGGADDGGAAAATATTNGDNDSRDHNAGIATQLSASLTLERLRNDAGAVQVMAELNPSQKRAKRTID